MDFIISKYREDPLRKLTFTKTDFVWGEEEESRKGRVKVEEGAPYGVRVVVAPNSMKPVAQLPPLPSFITDSGRGVGEQEKKNGMVCGSCKENCGSVHYKYTKEGSFILCEKCFKTGNYEKKKPADDFMLINSGNQSSVWTEAEILLLLESVLKQGDDWDLVAQDVQTKSKLDCISKLMELPFGDLMLRSAHKKRKFLDVTGDVACISTTVGPHVIASAAEAAVTAFCYENQCSREIVNEDDIFVDLKASTENTEQKRYSFNHL
ncbi:unnamed protein product [Fraxinus pennsylvanica]|uniref:SANT domain-containing protein n=1 Tax=Fraxinus pennsylvanica TaxID=56036 RepID=A0AAD2DM86_9LAMI|nr:unnamed protein product [Fraxinus pennsylvanica]